MNKNLWFYWKRKDNCLVFKLKLNFIQILDFSEFSNWGKSLPKFRDNLSEIQVKVVFLNISLKCLLLFSSLIKIKILDIVPMTFTLKLKFCIFWEENIFSTLNIFPTFLLLEMHLGEKFKIWRIFQVTTATTEPTAKTSISINQKKFKQTKEKKKETHFIELSNLN